MSDLADSRGPSSDPSADPGLPEIFAEVAELAGEARAARLSALRRESPAMAREVESLLAASTSVERRLDTPAYELLERTLPPERIGPYRLLREIGRGGMGRVFLAEQEGEEFRRLVALKMIDRPFAAEEAIRRFRAEVRILAGLEHPGIARFLDGGRTEEGVWFLALEYVEGENLLEFARQRKFDVRQRVELFLQVVDAVDFAHRSLVVHRDLKPANVLVGADGRARLLDFGISKMLTPETTDASEAVTQTELRRLTPAYASPEQLLGESVTVSTDVYSLGVVLHELLTGERPHGVEKSAGKNSENTGSREQARQDRQLGGDLDAIVAKALRPEIVSRYPSAAALGDDLRRWLDGRPVLARVGNRRYLAGKFVARHRLALAAAALAALGLAIGLGFALWQARIARHERNRAQAAAAQANREAESAERVADLLGRVFDAASPFEHPGPIDPRELLERGGAQIAQGLGAEPELRAQLAIQLADVWLRLGEVARAEALAAPAVADLERLRGTADALTARAWGTLGAVRRAQGKNAEARQLYERALAVQRATLGADHRLTLRTLMRFGGLQRAEGHFAEARASLEEASAGFERLGEGAAVDLAKAVGDLGLVLQRLEDWTGAELAHRRAHEILTRQFGADSPRAVLSLGNLAEVLQMLERGSEARAALEEVLRVNQKAFGTGGFPGESIARNSLAWLALEAGQPRAARDEFERAITAARKENGEAHANVAWPMRGQAAAELALGRRALAKALYESALELRTKFWGRQHWEVAQSLKDLADLAARSHDAGGEEKLRREALSIRRAVHPTTHPDVARSVIALGTFLCTHHQAGEGATLLTEGSTLSATSPTLAAEAERAKIALAACR